MLFTVFSKFKRYDFLVDYFEIISVDNSQESLHLYFKEKAKHPKEFDHTELVTKDLTDEITIQDFPLRGKFVYLQTSSLD
ncbi:ISAon1 family transposase N-terminal region protein [Flavobacterium davisii]|uniref:ISAon1 family transposase N-terminal region protein n=1 Tax=Flavobacterium davisii TaxID=2906077 RepID=UPI0040400174